MSYQRALLGVFACVMLCTMARSQQQPSVPNSENTFRAGETFQVEVTLKTAPKEIYAVFVSYQRTAETGEPDQSELESAFGCFGNAAVGKQTLLVKCATPIDLRAGVYRAPDGVRLTRSLTGFPHQQHDARVSIVSILENPAAANGFPEVAGTSLVLTEDQALRAGADRARSLLVDFSSHFPRNVPDTNENRAYFRSQVEQALAIVVATRDRYMAAKPENEPTPIIFQDFLRRYNKVLTSVGGKVTVQANLQKGRLQEVAFQRPQIRESIDAKIEKQSKLESSVSDFVTTLTDWIKYATGMSESGKRTFSWSVETDPQGAEVWYSRLGEEEIKWSSLTNIKGASLPYAGWKFRISWNGCSKYEKPDTTKEADIVIQLRREGCK